MNFVTALLERRSLLYNRCFINKLLLLLLLLFGLTSQKACLSLKAVEDFWHVHSSCIFIKCQVIDTDVDGFSGHMFAVFIYYTVDGDVGFTVDFNCTGYICSFTLLSRHLLDSLM